MKETIRFLQMGDRAAAVDMFRYESERCGVRRSRDDYHCEEQRGLYYRHPDCSCRFHHCPRIHEYVTAYKTKSGKVCRVEDDGQCSKKCDFRPCRISMWVPLTGRTVPAPPCRLAAEGLWEMWELAKDMFPEMFE